MDYDQKPLFPVSEYREMQRAVPGVEGLYRVLASVIGATVPSDSTVLVVGAGGGREIEVLGQLPRGYRLVGVDPSKDMIAVAQFYTDALGVADRVDLHQGYVEDLPTTTQADAATSVFVMHFLPDDDTKLAYLQAIRTRLKPGAAFILADVSFADPAIMTALEPVFVSHAELAGLSQDKALLGLQTIRALPIISEGRTHELLVKAGFSEIVAVYRGLWYAMWWAKANI